MNRCTGKISDRHPSQRPFIVSSYTMLGLADPYSVIVVDKACRKSKWKLELQLEALSCDLSLNILPNQKTPWYNPL